jgi:hypothetical protein
MILIINVTLLIYQSLVQLMQIGTKKKELDFLLTRANLASQLPPFFQPPGPSKGFFQNLKFLEYF